MKTYRASIYLCFWICIISLALLVGMALNIFSMLISNFEYLYKILYDNKEIGGLAYNITLGIFASAFIVLLTMLISYRYEKSKTIGKIKYYIALYIMELAEYIMLIFGEQNISALLNDANLTEQMLMQASHNIINNKEIYIFSKDLIKIRDDFLFNTHGYFPMLKKAKKNLVICKLLYYWTAVHCIVQKCNLVYRIHNNVIYRQDHDEAAETKEMLNGLTILAMEDNDQIYNNFISSYKKVLDYYPQVNLFNTDLRKKCL